MLSSATPEASYSLNSCVGEWELHKQYKIWLILFVNYSPKKFFKIIIENKSRFYFNMVVTTLQQTFRHLV